MKVTVPFGQYVPVVSPVHAVDARVKMGLVAVFAVGLFALEGFPGLLASGGVVALAVRLSRVPPRLVLRGLRAIGLILAVTLLANALRWDPATAALLRLGPLAVDAEGLARGAFFAGRIVLLVAGTSLLTLTSTPVEITDALEALLGPLERFRIPAGEIAMMLTIALRFIPTTAEEAERIIMAQAARGARFDVGGPIARARAYAPVLIPMFVSLFRRADALAMAMESRCYRGGEGRTRLNERKMRVSDWATLLIGAAAMTVVTRLW